MAAVSDVRSSMVNDGMFTSLTDEWGTPQEFFDLLDAEFGFEWDVCATAENAKCENYWAKEHDGLQQPWRGTCWMNPPYGRVIGNWVRKAYESSRKGATVVCLIPARTDTAYWHDYVMKADEIRLLRGRLQFVSEASQGHNAPFPSAVVIFRPEVTEGRYGGPFLTGINRKAS